MAKTLAPKSFKANIDRALHNLTCNRSTTLHPMTAVPIYFRRMFRGDKFDFGIMESILRSEPTFQPLLANWRLEFQWYFDSDANRYGWIDNNTRLTAEEVMSRRHHSYYITKKESNGNPPEISNYDTVGRGSIAEYSGIPAGFVHLYDSEEGIGLGTRVNIDFHLTYLNIIRNYHVNKQFPAIPYISQGIYDSDQLEYRIVTLDALDDLFMFLRSCPNGIIIDPTAQGVGGTSWISAPPELVSYYAPAVTFLSNYLKSAEAPYGGLFCTQYEPDLWQNLLSKDQGLLRAVVTEETVDGQTGITIEQFRLKNHLQAVYDKIFVSGGTDRDLSRTLWGIESNRDYDIPELLCVHSEIIGTNLIESTTAGQTIDPQGNSYKNYPGTMAGNLNTRRGKGRIQKFTAKTAGNLMCLVTLTPMVDYNQNIERYLRDINFMDEFNPDMARKGFEDVPLSDYCALPILDQDNNVFAPTNLDQVVGKQIAWLREMTAVNRVFGEFGSFGEKRDMVLTRRYVDESGVFSLSPYGRPDEWQYPFVAQTLLDPNFNLQVSVYNKAYRPVPRRFMPNLGY